MSEDEEASMSSNFTFMRVLKILRLARALRLVRLFRFVSELRAMVCSISNSFKSLLWTLVLLMLMIYVVSIYFTQLIADARQQRFAEQKTDLWKEDEVLHEHYRSLAYTGLTLYQAITGGVDWQQILRPILMYISPWQAIVFAVYIAFAVLALMNIVTGVFVESALISAKEDKDQDMRARVRHMFTAMDADGSGTIDWHEFVAMLNDKKNKKSLKQLGIDVSKMKALFALLVGDTSGVSIDELILGCQRLNGPAKAIDLEMLMYYNKQMATRWHSHANKVEMILGDLIRLVAGETLDEDEGSPRDHDPTATHATRYAMPEPGSQSAKLWMSWAELEAEGDRKAAAIRQKAQDEEELAEEAQAAQYDPSSPRTLPGSRATPPIFMKAGPAFLSKRVFGSNQSATSYPAGSNAFGATASLPTAVNAQTGGECFERQSSSSR
eukprot:gnl/TRDRNA2_/TRDRNA2_90292_c2_seq1.p1 gnl/TRDRNA2_/TRDRNA2_90292_c2~~gnl/TRDRNA2_/TRDRNA2_90292_c2_seq1.p1  ORF type:complete len:513 (-),score=99.68 gnl/TRDRNA2_/TRDRNA2_90292_c2_seq1:145-1461(-)